MSVTVPQRVRSAMCHPVTGLLAIAVVPIVVAYVRAVGHGWAPEGDDAVIADRMRAVFSAHPPLMGQRSTSVLTQGAEVATHHLGPLEYYVAAAIAGIFGFSGAGILLSIAVGNMICAAGSIAIAFRLRALRTAVPTTIAVLLLEWSLGPEQLVRPLNVYVAALPMLLTLVCAWAWVDGDRSVLWVYGVAASFVAQANLAFVPFVVGLSVALGLLGISRRWRNVRMPGQSPARMQRHWLVTAGLLFAVWLPTLLELILYSPNNLQQLLAYRSRSAGAGTSWPHAAAYVLDRLSPVGFGRFHNTYQPAVSGVTVAAGAIGVLLLALGAFAGTHRPNTVGSRACGVAVITVPVEAWGLTHLTGFTVGYWLLPCLVIAAFACAAVLTRAIELIPRRRWSSVLRLVPPVARTTIAALLATSACALASTTASPPAWAAEDQARHASAVVLRFLRQHANPGVPVVVQGSGISSLSLNSAIGFQLDRRGYHAYYLLSWPIPEDTDPWHVDHAPPTHVTVIISQRSLGGTWSDQRPTGSSALDLGHNDDGAELRAWVTIPDLLARLPRTAPTGE